MQNELGKWEIHTEFYVEIVREEATLATDADELYSNVILK